MDWFHDEQSCTSYLYALRWPNGFICPSCSSHQSPYQLSNGKLKCHACRSQCSVTSSKLFDKTRTPMKSWFAAVWFITNQKNGVRWLLGTYQGAVKAKQLDYYLDEFTFRFNRRKSDSRGLLFYRLLEQAVRSKPITYQSIKNR
ncbi:transposase [Shewanella baltica]|uniref:transposase n=1 Tax=Shewanella baltica TaxID=62322 RepID=UPI0009B6B3A1|nr:transposase [Shewanella baltica]